MTHDYHEALPGYSPEQILHDGCKECEARGSDLFDALCHLDRERWAKAWRRAILLQTDGLRDASEAELPLLRVLGGFAICLERYAGIPFGALPEWATL